MRPVPTTTRQRRGVTAMLAMIYLVLFSTLAIGFYAATTTSVQIVNNEQRITRALLAAESGMDFMSYHIQQIVVEPRTPLDEIFLIVSDTLSSRLESTGNVSAIAANAPYIEIPAPGEWLNLPNGQGQFRAIVEQVGEKLRVKIIGRYQGLQNERAVRMDFGLAEKASDIFDYGVASMGAVVTDGTSRIRGATDPKKGSVLSASMSSGTPVSIGGVEVSGDISIVNPSGDVTIKPGASVGGTTNTALIEANHIHKGVAQPEFPDVFTDIFEPFAKNTYSGGSNVENVRIPANTNPTFSGGTLNGVIYIEQPNKVTFKGNMVINGVIVADYKPVGTMVDNILSFSGTMTANPLNTLTPAQVPSLSAGELENLKKLTGAFVLAPNFTTSFTGNFGTLSGSIISDKVGMTGNAGGTVMGSIITLKDTPLTLNGTSEIIIASTGTTDFPAGVYFDQEYRPLGDTYTELNP